MKKNVTDQNPVIPMTKAHARAVAILHRDGIDTGFLSSLGLRFLTQLYKAIPSCPAGFGFVYMGRGDGEGLEGEEVLGFIACAESTGRLYKQSMWRRGILMGFPLMRYLFSPSVLRRIIHTMKYPSQTGEDLPAAEVLSVAVSDKSRGKGVGKALMKAAFAEFRDRGVGELKVAVGADNENANEYYKRCGFALAETREHHRRPMNVHVADAGENPLVDGS